MIKKGYFITKWNAQPVPRYQCKACCKCFSSHTFLPTYRQKKPFINRQLFQLYNAATTQRRMAMFLGISRTTFVRKFLFLARLSREEHARRISLGSLLTSKVQFDEMETFEHTRLKPLGMPLAVCGQTGNIIDVSVATMNAKGLLAEISVKKYGYRKDTREAEIERVLSTVKRCTTPGAEITCDMKGEYRRFVATCVPQARIRQVPKAKKIPEQRRNVDDELFRLNHTAAKIRHDLSRLMRKTWVTTKKAERLQAHLDLYIAYNNKYDIAA